MELVIITLVAVAMLGIGYWLGSRGKNEVQQEIKAGYEKRLLDAKETSDRQIAENKQGHEKMIADMRKGYENQLAELKNSHEKQMELLRKMNKEQMEGQLELMREQIRTATEQMKTTSEEVLKEREAALGERNKEQVSKIVDPLKESLKLMREALDDSKMKHKEALDRLDATMQANMKNSNKLGETAERLTRALTGDVKAQGNFGELKLKQLLEDMGLKEGEQFDSQAHIRDRKGNLVKDEDGRMLIPDFILHFPNNRHVVVDSKMSFTAYERYMNADDETERAQYLREHLLSVRAQVDRLAKKDYSRFLPEGYNQLNFVIMYVHTEGALNLALSNDPTLWREAYDKGVLIFGAQTMYMNLRILEMMWTQVRQLQNQEEMMKAATILIDRTQDFGIRFNDVETKMNDAVKSMQKLKITTADEGASIITAAKNLLKAGARENRKKKSLEELETE